MVVAATTPALPNLPREDRRRLLRFIALEENLSALAAELNAEANAEAAKIAEDQRQGDPGSASASSSDPLCPLRPLRSNPSDDLDEISLQTWLSHPDIAAHIDFRRRHRDHLSRTRAIAALEQVLLDTKDLIEKRRAASAILRTLNRAGAAPVSLRVSRGVLAPVSHDLPSEPRPSGSGPHQPPDETDLADDHEDDNPDETSTSDSGPRSQNSGPSSPYSPLPTPNSPPRYLRPSWCPPPQNGLAPPAIAVSDDHHARRSAFFRGLDTPKGAYFPGPSCCPDIVIEFILNALQRFDPADKVTLFNFSGIPDRCQQALDTFISGIQPKLPTRFASWRLESDEQTADHTYFANLTIINHDHTELPLTFNLHRPTQGPLALSWIPLWERFTQPDTS